MASSRRNVNSPRSAARSGRVDACRSRGLGFLQLLGVGQQPRSRGVLVKTSHRRHERVVLESFTTARTGNPRGVGNFGGQLGGSCRKAVLLQHISGDVEVLLIAQAARPPRRHVPFHLVEQRAHLRLAEILDESGACQRGASCSGCGICRPVQIGKVACHAIGFVDLLPAFGLRRRVDRIAHRFARLHIVLLGRDYRGAEHRREHTQERT